METCKHNLISGGKLCNEGCGIWLGPWNTSSYDSSYIQFPSGERATLHNNGVIVIPSSGKAHALGGVTSGASSKDRHLSSRGIHNRFNHRPAATLTQTPGLHYRRAGKLAEPQHGTVRKLLGSQQ